MEGPAEELEALRGRLEEVRKELSATQRTLLLRWEPGLVRESWRPSLRNLAAYVGLRRLDLRGLQARLAALGLSSLGRCEGHVEATLEAVGLALDGLLGRSGTQELEGLRRRMGEHRGSLERNTLEVLGPAPGHRRTRIMVTLPVEAAEDPALVREWLARGMDCARINMAHDGPEQWGRMVQHLTRARAVTGRPCPILMDLGGQKLRVGALAEVPAALHLRVKRDARGQVVRAAGALLDGGGGPGRPSGRDGRGRRTPVLIPVDPAWLRAIRVGESVHFVDLTGRRRTLQVVGVEADGRLRVHSATNAFLEAGTVLEHRPPGRRRARRCGVGPIAGPPPSVLVCEGDFLRLTGPAEPGGPAVFDELGELISCAHIPCEQAGVFRHLRPGERVFVDDGSIEAEVMQAAAGEALLKVTRARPEGDKLRPGKGINFPDSRLELDALSGEDLEHLPLVARWADLVGYSFVQEPEDLDRLDAALAAVTDRNLPVLAKIETARAVRNLPDLIARGAGRRPFGVMIARGDLAVEIGYERMAEIQEELLWLCEAAHVPVVWATQVLETLLKRGVPTRAEMTDAAMSMRAECVMLNKGPHLAEALVLLDGLEDRMRAHQAKKRSMLRALHW